jgi:hypothetical protein
MLTEQMGNRDDDTLERTDGRRMIVTALRDLHTGGTTSDCEGMQVKNAHGGKNNGSILPIPKMGVFGSRFEGRVSQFGRIGQT